MNLNDAAKGDVYILIWTIVECCTVQWWMLVQLPADILAVGLTMLSVLWLYRVDERMINECRVVEWEWMVVLNKKKYVKSSLMVDLFLHFANLKWVSSQFVRADHTVEKWRRSGPCRFLQLLESGKITQIYLPIRRCPSKFMNVTMWEHCTFDSKIFWCGKVYYSNSIIITNFVQILIPNHLFENVFPTNFGIEMISLCMHTKMFFYLLYQVLKS
jgi:hypothetical protein